MCSLHLTHPSVHTWSSGQPTVQRPGSSDHLDWIRTGSGGYSDLGIRKKQTNISVDVILLTMQQLHCVLWEVFPVPVDLINAA